MALTPDTMQALSEALDAVIAECGDDPKYAELVDALSAAQDAMPDADHESAHEDHAEGNKEEPADDRPDNFDDAQRRFLAHRSSKGDAEAKA